MLLHNKMLTNKCSRNNRVWNQCFAINMVIIDLGKKLKSLGASLLKRMRYFPTDYLLIIKGRKV